VGEMEGRAKYQQAAPTWRLHQGELKRDGALTERATSDLCPYLIVEIRLKSDDAGDRRGGRRSERTKLTRIPPSGRM
jgi:hypothetical protein